MSEVDWNDIEVVCTWNVGNKRNIKDTLTIKLPPAESGLQNMVTLETCVHLISQENSTSPCELKIMVPRHRPLQIIQVSITSEARIIELHGQCGEYLTTMEAKFIEECEEMPVYIAETKLLEPSSECLLKFVRSKRKEDMWLYGINIQLQKTESPTQFETSVNFQNVNKILKESGHQLTEKADKCKKFLQLYGSTLDANKFSKKPDSLQMFMKMFESKCLHKYNQFANDTKNCSLAKSITNDLLPEVIMPSKVTAPPEGTEQATLESGDGWSSAESCVESNLKQHVEHCFRKLEIRLMTKIEQKLGELERKQNEKCDLILLQLQKIQDKMTNN